MCSHSSLGFFSSVCFATFISFERSPSNNFESKTESYSQRPVMSTPSASATARARLRAKLPVITHTSEFRRALRLGCFFGFVSVSGYIYTSKRKNVGCYLQSYYKIPDLVARRTHHHEIPLPVSQETKGGEEGKATVLTGDLSEYGLSVPFGKSVEPLLILDARKTDAAVCGSRSTTTCVAVVSAESKEVTPLCESLDTRPWSQFLSNTNGSSSSERSDETVFISFGARRAFGSPLNRLGLLHAVILVQVYANKSRGGQAFADGTKRGSAVTAAVESSLQSAHFGDNSQIDLAAAGGDPSRRRFALFGYNAGGGSELFINDMQNKVDRVCYIYPDLTMKCSATDALAFFRELERRSKFDYKLFSCNCFSPIMATMLHFCTGAHSNCNSCSFQTPEFFLESMPLTIALQSNFGFGTTSNANLRPYVDAAAAAANLLVQDRRAKA